ncbi:hypothetical protein [Streptomyces sp. 8P21H-1]|uniref:hypothetical protein n=1 Tax=Streptomyces sp. 8P21H-1 TaxID=2737048 RepID=UPI00156E0FC2|nr:hypothetical protein [Streptomyces sp. 8P21H-1]NSL42741.1 hypothetical protein [Streptomyces sp. 8P21H-1]
MIAAGLLATGCSGGLTGNTADVAAPSVGPSPKAPPTGYDGLVGLPLSEYGTSEKEDLLLYQTNEALVAQCMKSRGHATYSKRKKTISPKNTRAEKEVLRPAGNWGYIGHATAKRVGFHVAVPLPFSEGPKGRELKDYNVCWDRAEKKLPSLTNTKGWKLTQDLFGRSFQVTSSDSRVAVARKNWSSCMSAAGHPAEDPQKLADSFRDAKKASVKEIAAAIADESCTRSSNLAGIYFAVLTGYQQRLIAANTKVLTDYKKQVHARVDRAARLLAAPGTT